MILEALSEYYRRKTSGDDAELAPPGFEPKEIPFVLVLDREGRLVQIDDLRDPDGKRAKRQLVPQAVKRTVGVSANLLWDSLEYVLGFDSRGKPDRVARQHEDFRERIERLAGDDEALRAVKKFLAGAPLEEARQFPSWPSLAEGNPLVSFRLAGDADLVPQRPAVRRLLEEGAPSESGARCLVTGRRDRVARLHPSIKGVRDAQSSGASLVSYNAPAFCSFGKDQGENAPVGQEAVFAYTTALNHLLRSGSPQRIQLGDATTVFWSEKASGRPVEQAFASWFDPPRDDPDVHVESVRALYEFQRGKPLTEDDRQRFFVLGLAPNAARLAVRFWQVATIAELGERIFRHFAALEIVRPPKAPAYPSLPQLLASIALQGKLKNVPPGLAGEWLRSILAGTPYPRTLLEAAIRRCRAEQAVPPSRAALIKACLLRSSSSEKENLTVSLDLLNVNPGYRLGRLFAVFEKLQEDASPGLNATIRDRYFGSASSSPRVAFSVLNRLKNHHLAKISNRGLAVVREKLIGEIMSGIDAENPFPARLSLADQGRFVVGYYHQRQAFFEKPGGHE